MPNDTELVVRPEHSVYRAGDDVNASITLSPRNLTVRGGTAQLVCSGHYRGAFSKHHSGEAWVTHFKAQQNFVDASQVRSGERFFNVQFTLPTDAPPTYAGNLIAVQWKIKAKLDIPHRVDKTAEARITVLRSPLAGNVQLDMPHRGAACDVSFDVPSVWVRAGGNLEGTVLVNPVKDVEITGAQLELLRIEVVYTGSVTRQSQKREKILKLADASKSVKGLMEGLGFRVVIPENSRPFLAVREARGYYALRAKIAIKGQIDRVPSIPLFIYNG